MTTNTAANVAALAATPVTDAAFAGWEAYDLVATVGDSWRLLVDKTNKKARIKMRQSSDVDAVDDTDSDVRTVNITEANNKMTITSTAGNALDVTIDTRTKNVTGTVTVKTAGGGTKASAVSGTGYQVTNNSKLAGDYAWVGYSSAPGGGSPDTQAGTFRIADNGLTGYLCPGTLINASNTCDVVGTSSTTPAVAFSIAADGRLTAGDSSGPQFGYVRAVPSDLGTTLLIDRSGYNLDDQLNPTPYYRIGVFAARKLTALAGTEFNGQWLCVRNGATKTIVVSGTSATNPANGNSANLDYNKLGILVSGNRPSLNGVVATYDNSGTYDTIVPMSSSLAMLFNHENEQVEVCSRTN